MDVYAALSAARSRGRPAVLVTVIGMDGDPPSRTGAKLVVVDGAAAAGTLGCAEFDGAAVELAAELVAELRGAGSAAGSAQAGAGATVRRRVVMRGRAEQAIELFAERHDPVAGVTVIGDLPVGRAVAELATFTGLRAVLVGDGDPVRALTAAPPGPRDAVIVVDHDAGYVTDLLRLVLAGEAFYVGMLGSRRHAPAVIERLRGTGLPADRIDRLHSPCGLDIGSRSPAEIALSIVAQVLAVERGRPGGNLAPVR